MSDVKEAAHKDYLSGMKYKDIAHKHGVSLSTVKSWARRDWKRLQPPPKKVATKNEKVATKNEAAHPDNPQKTDDEILLRALEENTELSNEQREFCLHFVRTYNATKSYQKAYGCSYNAAKSSGHEALTNPNLISAIDRLKKLKRLQLMADEDDLVEMHMRIAFADITDFVIFGQEEVPIKGNDDEDEENIVLTRRVNYVRFRESDEVDGQLIKEIRLGKDGASIKLADRQKSLDFLARWFVANPLDKHKIAYDNARLALEREKLKDSANETAQAWFDEIIKADE